MPAQLPLTGAHARSALEGDVQRTCEQRPRCPAHQHLVRFWHQWRLQWRDGHRNRL